MTNLAIALSKVFVTTPPTKPSANPPGANAQDGIRDTRHAKSSPRSPALSTASTAGVENEIESSPILPPLPGPSLPGRALQLLRASSPLSENEDQFETASWGSPYPRNHRNLRLESFSSEPSDDSPIHHLTIETPFLRAPQDFDDLQGSEPAVSAAAEVLANRVRRQTRGLTEDWIRTHTAGDFNTEPRHWFSDGSESEHSSLSGSEVSWLEEPNLRTPKATRDNRFGSPQPTRSPRARSSIETLRPGNLLNRERGVSKMAADQVNAAIQEADTDYPAMQDGKVPVDADVTSEKNVSRVSGELKPPSTPTRAMQKPLPKEPVATPRLKKKVPWKGKNILILLPRDDQRGHHGKPPKPLRQQDIQRMFDSWRELGYSVDGFDLLVEEYQPPGTSESQSRLDWPTTEDVTLERAQKKYKVAWPNLNGKPRITIQNFRGPSNPAEQRGKNTSTSCRRLSCEPLASPLPKRNLKHLPHHQKSLVDSLRCSVLAYRSHPLPLHHLPQAVME